MDGCVLHSARGRDDGFKSLREVGPTRCLEALAEAVNEALSEPVRVCLTSAVAGLRTAIPPPRGPGTP